MRLIFASLSAIIAIGTVATYLQFADQPVTAAPEIVTETSAETYRLEVVLSFAAGVDPFAENIDTASSLIVQLGSRELYSNDQTISAGEKVVIKNIDNLTVGKNEIYLEATPEDSSQFVPQVAKVSVYASTEDEPISTQYLWADSTDAKLAGNIYFGVEKSLARKFTEED